jgi:glutaredoxin
VLPGWARARRPEDDVYQREIVLYTRSRSLRCWRAKRFLSRQGYRYEVVDTTDNPELVAELSESVHHRVALPYVFVDHRPVAASARSGLSPARVP